VVCAHAGAASAAQTAVASTVFFMVTSSMEGKKEMLRTI
jgi:hypothetical protein